MLEDQNIRNIFCQVHKTNLKKIYLFVRHQRDVDDLLRIVEHNVDLEVLHANFDLYEEYNEGRGSRQARDECCRELLKLRPKLKIAFV